MKKLFTFLALVLLPFVACAEIVEINGIYYKLNGEGEANPGGGDPGGGDVLSRAYDSSNEEENYAVVTQNPSKYSGDIIIPEKFEYNGDTYYVTAIEGIDYDPEGGAFHDCSNLSSISIPKTIKSIGYFAFSGCTSLNAVYISDLEAWCNISFTASLGSTWFSTSCNPLSYAHDLYLNGNLIVDLVIPEKNEIIGDAAFTGGSFKTVTFHKNVNGICRFAFVGCDMLTDVYSYSPEITLSTFRHSSFDNVSNMILHIRKVYEDFYTNYDAYGQTGWKDFGKIEYIEGYDYTLSYLLDGELYKSQILEVGESITLEPDPTKEGYTFSGWSEIPETMPDHDVTVSGKFTVNKYKLTYKVDEKEYKTYEVEYNSAITPENQPVKKGMTFSGWSEIPAKMPSEDVVVNGSFRWSKSTIDKVIYEVSDTINNYCKAIGNESASGAIKIAEAIDFDYSYKVTSITDNTFSGCTDITSIEISATVTTIGGRAFANIDKLTDVTVNSEEIPETDRTAFENSYIEDYVTLHVPAASVDKYKNVAPWKNFKNILAINGTEESNDDTGEEVIPISSAGQTTWCSAYDLDFTDVEGLKAYIATGYDRETGVIWLTRVKKVPAGEGILLIGGKGDYTVPHVSTSAYYVNMMVGTLKAIVLNETEGEYTNYYLSNGTSGVGFYKVNGSVDIKANRAYLPLLKGTTKAGTRFIGIGFEDEDGTTGISNISNNEKDVWYNIQGQRVDKPSKGLYIHNGKKVVIK